jgi:hypothetical protein
MSRIYTSTSHSSAWHSVYLINQRANLHSATPPLGSYGCHTPNFPTSAEMPFSPEHWDSMLFWNVGIGSQSTRRRNSEDDNMKSRQWKPFRTAAFPCNRALYTNGDGFECWHVNDHPKWWAQTRRGVPLTLLTVAGEWWEAAHCAGRLCCATLSSERCLLLSWLSLFLVYLSLAMPISVSWLN